MSTQLPTNLSIVSGPRTLRLCEKTLGEVIDEQASLYGGAEAVVIPWQSCRLSYRDLAKRSKVVARALLRLGLQPGDRIGIMAGNCYQYLELFLGAGRVGCPAVVINNTFSPDELKRSVLQVGCRILFIAPRIGSRSLDAHIKKARGLSSPGNTFKCHLVAIDGINPPTGSVGIDSYNTFLDDKESYPSGDTVAEVERRVNNSDILNFQFTSGTTGHPKAACLTHRNLINNAIFVGRAMRLTTKDVVCCPPPLFHCFGLVMGFLASFCHGSKIVFPSDGFNADQTMEAVVREKATALLGVPTMFMAELESLQRTKHNITTVRTGLAAGSSIPPSLMKKLRGQMGIGGMLIAYGMTETSPVTFITSLGDSEDRMFNTIGRVMPHTSAKIIDSQGNIVPIGVRGEICTSGYALQKGYWQNEAKTREAMKPDNDGVVWMHTGDEGCLDSEGYCAITGRIKDLIIRGGENISPGEIEDCLLEHASVSECCAVGLADARYGEVVGVFLKAVDGAGQGRPSDDEFRAWVSGKMGRVKAPKYIFWVGDTGVGDELPKTGSGKYQKHVIRTLGNKLVKEASGNAVAKL